MKKTIIIVTLLFTMLQSNSFQQDMNVLKRMYHQVSASNGWIDKTTHQKFWYFIRKKAGNKEALVIVNTLKKSMLNAQEIQKENYKSALLSFDNKKIIKTKRLLFLEKSRLSNFKKTIPYPKTSKRYKATLDAFMKEEKSTSKSTKSFFNAAANHSIWYSNGASIKVTREMLTRTLNSIDASFKRVNKLLDPVWKK